MPIHASCVYMLWKNIDLCPAICLFVCLAVCFLPECFLSYSNIFEYLVVSVCVITCVLS